MAEIWVADKKAMLNESSWLRERERLANRWAISKVSLERWATLWGC